MISSDCVYMVQGSSVLLSKGIVSGFLSCCTCPNLSGHALDLSVHDLVTEAESYVHERFINTCVGLIRSSRFVWVNS